MRTETLAIVFTDIKGYTATTSAQTHEQQARMLRRVEKLIAPVVKGFGGRIVKSIGDAYMIVFKSPTVAVQCATAVQDRLHQHNDSADPAQAVHLRIAMNLGEVRVHRGDVFGEPVNIAARMESITPAGEIYISDAVYLTMNRSETPTESVGHFEFKGIPDPVMAHRIKKISDAQQPIKPGEGTAETTSPGMPALFPVEIPGLPYGGQHLVHWRKNRWTRVAYGAMWVLGMLGLAAGGYSRYGLSASYSNKVKLAEQAARADDAIAILAAVGEIPANALAEQDAVRRYRYVAVSKLLDTEDHKTANNELKALLAENSRDAEALILRSRWFRTKGRFKAAYEDIKLALEVDDNIRTRSDVLAEVVYGYAQHATRKGADALLELYFDGDAIPALVMRLNDQGFGDRATRHALAGRIKALGGEDQVDWVVIGIDDLKSTSCTTRKAAIAKLVSANDERAVGPLLKLADAKGCGAKQARNGASGILRR